jgi:hypothetical protein
MSGASDTARGLWLTAIMLAFVVATAFAVLVALQS